MAALLLCLGLLLAAVVQFSPVDSALPCNHPLRKHFPVYFGHCNSSCSYGPWGPWQPPVIERNATCASGEQRKYNRTRTAVPASNCPRTLEYHSECKQPQTSINFRAFHELLRILLRIGILTPKEKAEQLIRSLRLAADANPATQPPVKQAPTTQPPAKHGPTTQSPGTQSPPSQPPATHPNATQTTTLTTPSLKHTTVEPRPLTTNSPKTCSPTGDCKPSRGRRQASTINYCPNPSEQANNRICPDMCDIDRPGRPTGVPCSKCTMHSGTSLYLVVVTGCV